MNTTSGQMMSTISGYTNEHTPLQARLHKLTSSIGKVGLAVAFLVLVVLLVRYFTGNTEDENGNQEFIGSKTKVVDMVNSVGMMADQAMVRKLSACETMGSATTICTDKTGILTLNQMEVTKATSGSKFEFSDSPIEKAILSWAVRKLDMDMETTKLSCTILHVEPFNSEKKRSGVSMRSNADNTIHVHWKGAAEMILAICSSYYDASGSMKDLDDGERMKFEQIIEGMAARSLRCIAFAHKQIPEEDHGIGAGLQKLKEDNLTLIGLVGIEDPCRPGVREAVETCRCAGVDVKMITGDNIFIARAIATDCGILRPDQGTTSEVVVEGECLKQKGHVVAVTGERHIRCTSINGSQHRTLYGLYRALKLQRRAQISSYWMIILILLARVFMWGRFVHYNVQKFIQLQLTVTLAALVINVVAVVSAHEVLFDVLSLLWLTLILDTLCALALATQQPTKDLNEGPPVSQTQPLITNIMWRNIFSSSSISDSCRPDPKVFNLVNAKKLEKKNKLFWGITGIAIVLEVVAGRVFEEIWGYEEVELGTMGCMYRGRSRILADRIPRRVHSCLRPNNSALYLNYSRVAVQLEKYFLAGDLSGGHKTEGRGCTCIFSGWWSPATGVAFDFQAYPFTKCVAPTLGHDLLGMGVHEAFVPPWPMRSVTTRERGTATAHGKHGINSKIHQMTKWIQDRDAWKTCDHRKLIQPVEEPVDRLWSSDQRPVEEGQKPSLSPSSLLFPVKVIPLPVEELLKQR
ncbi:putative calcium-transporting ATPase 13, plasma membrane-type [Vitis vinifera]|uniref:Putative calcium-transporting ATPase 13, plasma membrane-type n=1 Tax=Vitis vinifera TaxID=29760 RepID=A0A438E5I6_VITVI|nr:putative calcium-transporting ATPase 13, plasma membrane-type [Vitis vinifera]